MIQAASPVLEIELPLSAERPRLRRRAQRWLGSAYAARVDPSDVVQETLLDASLAATRPTELLGVRRWLSRILWRNCLSAVEKSRRQRRDVSREQPLPYTTGGGVLDIPADATPALQCALRTERAEQLRIALTRLSSDARAVLRYRSEEDLTFVEIGERLEMSPDAARMLWARALVRLRSELSD